MQLDPSRLDPIRWLVALAGFIYDWIITREWSRAALCWVPVFLLAVVGVAAASGSWRDPNRMAQWYLELGDEEVVEWEQAWAPTAAPAPSPADGSGPAPAGDTPTGTEASASTAGEGDSSDDDDSGQPAEEAKRVSRFAETLFRRVQMLVPNERSRFVIGATLAQRGAIEQARAILTQIAPEEGSGYAPSHAFLAQLLLLEYPQKLQTEEEAVIREQLMHHISQAKRWERCPQSLMRAGSDLYLLAGNTNEAIALLATSAERHPDDLFALCQRARMVGEQRLFDQTWPRAEQYLLAVLAENAKDVTSRLQLAQTYAMAGQLDRSEEVLREVPEADRTPEIIRSLSQVYLMRYGQSQSQVNDKVTLNLKFLDIAMRLDPSNPYVAEEIAKLARMQGANPSLEMIEHLKSRLAEGTATAITHACLGEMRLLRKELDKAIPHLEQVVNRLPNAADSLNNLAYCLAELHPERYQEALEYSTRAVAESKKEPNADYYDTLAHVLSRMDRHKEAITAIETAIELDRQRSDFHERAAVEYKFVGDESMAQIHLDYIERLKVEEAARIEAERLAAERRAAEEKLVADQLEAERLKAEKLEALRYAAEQALAAMAEETSQPADQQAP